MFRIQYKRRLVSLEERVQIIKDYQLARPKPKFQTLTEKYNISGSQLRDILQNKEETLKAYTEAGYTIDDFPPMEPVSRTLERCRHRQKLSLEEQAKVLHDYNAQPTKETISRLAFEYNVSVSLIMNLLLRQSGQMETYQEQGADGVNEDTNEPIVKNEVIDDDDDEEGYNDVISVEASELLRNVDVSGNPDNELLVAKVETLSSPLNQNELQNLHEDIAQQTNYLKAITSMQDDIDQTQHSESHDSYEPQNPEVIIQEANGDDDDDDGVIIKIESDYEDCEFLSDTSQSDLCQKFIQNSPEAEPMQKRQRTQSPLVPNDETLQESFNNFQYHCNIEKLLQKPFSKRYKYEQIEIIKKGRPIPDLTELTKHGNTEKKHRRKPYQITNYKEKSWLCGCLEIKKIFCWPCLLFADKNVWTLGSSGMNSLKKTLKTHEITSVHLNHSLDLQTFKNNNVKLLADDQKVPTVTQDNEQMSENYQMVEQLIESICFLNAQDEFESPDKKTDSVNDLLNLIAKYDTKLHSQLAKAQKFKDTSERLQKNFVSAIAAVIRKNIAQEIDQTDFISLILDETIDATNGQAQLSIIFRYVDGKGVARERFYKHLDIAEEDRTAAIVTQKLKQLIQQRYWSDKLIAQTYTGAAVTYHDLQGIQAQLRTEFPNAISTHCTPHVMDLVLTPSANSLQEAKIFFITLSELSAFFCQSLKRRRFFDEVVKRHVRSIATTRWNYTSRLVNTVHSYHTQLIHVFEEMIDDPYTWSLEALQARGFLQFLKTFNTVFMLKTFHALAFTGTLFEVLQKSYTIYPEAIPYCSKHIELTKQQIANIKTKFDRIFQAAQSITDARPNSIETLDSFKSRYSQVFNDIIDSMLTQLDNRYRDLQNLKLLELFHAKKLKQCKKPFPLEAFERLEELYGTRFDLIKLRNELNVFYVHPYFKDINIIDIPSNLLKLELRETFSEILKLSCLAITLPLPNTTNSAAAAEANCSAVKRIKMWSNNQRQEDMATSEMALISIERAFLKDIKTKDNFHEEVIKIFIKKCARVDLSIK